MRTPSQGNVYKVLVEKKRERERERERERVCVCVCVCVCGCCLDVKFILVYQRNFVSLRL